MSSLSAQRIALAFLIGLFFPAFAHAEEVSGFCSFRQAPQWSRYVGRTPAFVRDELGPADTRSARTVIYRSVRCGSPDGPASLWEVTLHLGSDGRIARISQRRTGGFGCRITSEMF